MLQLTFIPGLSRRGTWRANIEAVRLASSLRGRGVGSWLIAQALETARARGCGLAQLTSDKRRTEAHRFYERLDSRRRMSVKSAPEATNRCRPNTCFTRSRG